MDELVVAKADISESYLVSMVRDVLANTTSDNEKIKDLNFIMDNTQEYTRNYNKIHHILQSTENQEFHGIPGFHTIQPISKGGFGKVYQAIHSVDGQTYAIKAIPMKFSNDSMVTDTIINRLKEVRGLARLEHPNIIRYYNSWLDIGITSNIKPTSVTNSKSHDSLVEYGSSRHVLDWDTDESVASSISRSTSFDSIVPVLKDGSRYIRTTLFLQTERMEMNLRDWINQSQSTLTYARDVIEIMKQISRGVEYLHTMSPSIIHCDLKPENILLNCQGSWPIQVKVADFGLINIEGGTWLLGKYEGTSTYKAPELKDTGDSLSMPSTASDIYSLGIMFFEMLCPFSTTMERSLKIQQLKQGSLLTNTIIDRMVAAHPSQRPSITETIAEIKTVERTNIQYQTLDEH